MITIIKTGGMLVQFETNIIVHDDGVTIIAQRWIDGLKRIVTTCDGTTIDMMAKVNNLGTLSNDVFKTFARVQQDELDNV